MANKYDPSSVVLRVGGVVLRGLTDEERSGPAVLPVDIDPVPPHVRQVMTPMPHDAGWVDLWPAAHALGLGIEQVLRIWYSGLCDAGILLTMPSGQPVPRTRFLRLTRWSQVEGHELLEAVQGKERLQGYSCDLGRSGLLHLIQQEVNDPISAAMVGRPYTENTLRRVEVLTQELLERLKGKINACCGRFQLTSASVSTQKMAPHPLSGKPVDLLVNTTIELDDLMVHQPMRIGYSFRL